MLTTGETFPTNRLLTDEVEGTEMEGVEHLGQYVFEMTEAKVEMLKKGRNVLPAQEDEVGLVEDKEMEGEGSEGKVEQAPDESESELDEIT